MPRFIADFHIHSCYSRACSKDLSIAELAKWATVKGIGLMGTGDFTHPQWVEQMKDALRDAGDGLYEHGGVRFMPTSEVNTLYYKGGKAHQIHHILMAPSLATVERINQELAAFGDLALDGRPMLRMEAKQLVKIVVGVDPRAAVIPAHAWTPHFSVFGSNSGFDRIEDCFEEETRHIFALETGLSSDPAMNWRLSALDRYALISNSDSHSARRIGREANRFDCAYSYDEILGALKARDRTKFLGTIEFFPEEGKYHYDGHRACGIRWAPSETKQRGARCPVCGRKLTVGVMNRVETLADRPEGAQPEGAAPFTRMVPLEEIIAKALEAGVGTKGVEREYQKLIHAFGTEFAVLLDAPEDALRGATSARIAEGIVRVREGRIDVEPGYDGEYGNVHIFTARDAVQAAGEQQMTLF